MVETYLIFFSHCLRVFRRNRWTNSTATCSRNDLASSKFHSLYRNESFFFLGFSLRWLIFVIIIRMIPNNKQMMISMTMMMMTTNSMRHRNGEYFLDGGKKTSELMNRCREIVIDEWDRRFVQQFTVRDEKLFDIIIVSFSFFAILVVDFDISRRRIISACKLFWISSVELTFRWSKGKAPRKFKHFSNSWIFLKKPPRKSTQWNYRNKILLVYILSFRFIQAIFLSVDHEHDVWLWIEQVRMDALVVDGNRRIFSVLFEWVQLEKQRRQMEREYSRNVWRIPCNSWSLHRYLPKLHRDKQIPLTFLECRWRNTKPRSIIIEWSSSDNFANVLLDVDDISDKLHVSTELNYRLTKRITHKPLHCNRMC